MPLRLLILALLTLPAAAQTHVYGLRPDSTPVTALAPPTAKLLVLFFVASDCPVSNRTFPEMQRIRHEYESQGVAFWFVYPNVGESLSAVRAHQQAFDPAGEAILDTSGQLARLAHAIVTPEVSVLMPSATSWKPLYTGRIDDRYVRLGLERPAATQHFAERVIAAALRGAPIERPTGTPVGCGIVSPAR
jgi:hypothetical protein